ELEDDVVAGREDVFLLDTNTYQIGDVEKAAVIDFFEGDHPEGEPEGLLFQQPVQQARFFTELAQCGVESCPRLEAVAVELESALFDGGRLVKPEGDLCRFDGGGRGNVADERDDRLQFGDSFALLRVLAGQVAEPHLEDA